MTKVANVVEEGAVKSAETVVVSEKKKVITQNSKQAEKLLAEKTGAKKDAGKTETKKPGAKAKKERKESNEAIGERLFAAKATKEALYAEFLKVYKEKKGITDKAFVKARADIYWAIAEKRAAAKKAPAVKKAS